MQKRLPIIVLLLVLLLPLAFARGSIEPAKTVQLSIMHGWGGSASDHQAMRTIFNDFANDNPDIDVVFTAYPDLTIVLRKINDAQAVGNVPDVVSVNGHALAFHNAKKRGLALDLSPYLKADPVFSSDVSERVRSSLKEQDGSLFTIPEVIETIGYWYNKDLLEQAGIKGPPTSWEALIKAVEVISENTDSEGVALDNWQLALVFSASLASQSEESLAFFQRNRAQPPKDDVLKAMDTVIALSRLGRYDLSSVSSRDMFYAGKTAFYFNGVWANPQHSTQENKERLLPASYPGYQGEQAAFVSAAPGFIVSSRATSEKQDAAVRFITYMVSEEVQRRIYAETGQVPENSKITTQEMIDTSPELGNAIKICLEAEQQLYSYSLVLNADQLLALEAFCKNPQDVATQQDLLACF